MMKALPIKSIALELASHEAASMVGYLEEQLRDYVWGEVEIPKPKMPCEAYREVIRIMESRGWDIRGEVAATNISFFIVSRQRKYLDRENWIRCDNCRGEGECFSSYRYDCPECKSYGKIPPKIYEQRHIGKEIEKRRNAQIDSILRKTRDVLETFDDSELDRIHKYDNRWLE